MAAAWATPARRSARRGGGRFDPDYQKMRARLREPAGRHLNSALERLKINARSEQAKALAKARKEVFLHQNASVLQCDGDLRPRGLLAVFSWFNLSETLRRSAVWLIALAFCDSHDRSLNLRMVLEGRPPVTNLYSSASSRLGRVPARNYSWKDFQETAHRRGPCLRAWPSITLINRASTSRITGETPMEMDARGAGHEFLARHARRRRDNRLREHVRGGFLALIYIVRGVFTKTLDEATANRSRG